MSIMFVGHRVSILYLQFPHYFPVRLFLLTPACGQEIDEEGEHVEGEDQGDDPFKHRTYVLPLGERADGEDYG